LNRIEAGCVFLLLSLSAVGATAQPAREPPRVLASFRPIHSIAATVMDGVATPALLINGSASPHAYALRPSDALKLDEADIIFWIGPELEAFLEAPLKSLAPDAEIVALIDQAGLSLLPVREGGLWEADEHSRHDESDATDPHLWLDPANAAVIADAMAFSLTLADPDNAERYLTNAGRFAERVAALDVELDERLRPVRNGRYIVMHDAYQYFEARYGQSPAGSVTVAADRPAGARRIVEIRNRIANSEIACVFSPPQFSPRLVGTLTEVGTARTATLDDLGTEIAPGPGLYEALLRGLADSFLSCLTP
jgi:zinc transport system substrate-binding protein